MNAIVVLFALAAVAEDERCVAPAVVECAAPKIQHCSRSAQRSCCRSLLGSLFGHRKCRESKSVYKEMESKPVYREMEVVADPRWYVHRTGTGFGNYWYEINHKSTGAKCGPYDTIDEAGMAVLCQQTSGSPCDPCTPNPVPPATTSLWYTHRFGTAPSDYWYRINHIAISTAERCPPRANPDLGYVNTDLLKAVNAMVGFQNGTCPPCPPR